MAVLIPGFVSVLIGRGDGTFQPQPSIFVPGDLQAMLLGDVDGNGKPDVVTATSYDQVAVLINTTPPPPGNSTATFELHTTAVSLGIGWPWPSPIVLGDLNPRVDHQPDLAVANFNLNTVSALLGNGDGTFMQPVDVATGHVLSVAIGNLNPSLDSDPDLLWTTAGSYPDPDTASAMLGDGYGSFTPSSSNLFIGDYGSITLGNLNSSIDTDPDVVAGSTLWLGNGDGTFRPGIDLRPDWSGYYSSAIGDLNLDGSPDVVGVKPTVLDMWLGNGDSTFELERLSSSGWGDPVSVAIGYLDRDRRPDMAVANYFPSTVSVFLNTSQLVGVDTTPVKTIALFVTPNPSLRPILSYDIAQVADVRLGIYDLSGRLIRVLRDEVMVPGRYSQRWSGLTDGGQTVRPGIYFARLTTGNETRSATIAFLQ